MTEKLTGNSTKCPHCGSSLLGPEIPEASRTLFGGANFLRVIGIEKQDDDYISAYRCPDCGTEDSRF